MKSYQICISNVSFDDYATLKFIRSHIQHTLDITCHPSTTHCLNSPKPLGGAVTQGPVQLDEEVCVMQTKALIAPV